MDITIFLVVSFMFDLGIYPCKFIQDLVRYEQKYDLQKTQLPKPSYAYIKWQINRWAALIYKHDIYKCIVKPLQKKIWEKFYNIFVGRRLCCWQLRCHNNCNNHLLRGKRAHFSFHGCINKFFNTRTRFPSLRKCCL